MENDSACFSSRNSADADIDGRPCSDRREFLKVAGSAALAAAMCSEQSEAQPTSLGAYVHHGSGTTNSSTFTVRERVYKARQLSKNGVAFEYFELGNEDGTPLFLVHGFPDSPMAWQEVVRGLDPLRYRLILPYLRGYGGTLVNKPEEISGQFAALAHDLMTLADALKIERFHVVGHDWGARTAYATAVLAPNRLLTLTGLASPYLAWKGAALLPPAQVHGYWYQLYFQNTAAETMLTEHRQDFCRELWKVWCPNWSFTEAEFRAAAEAWINPQFVSTVLNYYRIRWSTANGQPAYADLQARLDRKPEPKISVPTLFIQGEADACDLMEGADGQERAFSGSYQRLVVPRVGHFPHRENPAAVAEALTKHLTV